MSTNCGMGLTGPAGNPIERRGRCLRLTLSGEDRERMLAIVGGDCLGWVLEAEEESNLVIKFFRTKSRLMGLHRPGQDRLLGFKSGSPKVPYLLFTWCLRRSHFPLMYDLAELGTGPVDVEWLEDGCRVRIPRRRKPPSPRPKSSPSATRKAKTPTREEGLPRSDASLFASAMSLWKALNALHRQARDLGWGLCITQEADLGEIGLSLEAISTLDAKRRL